MFGRPRKIRIDDDLYERLQQSAAQAGYASVDELITHALERQLSNLQADWERQQADRQLRGLGYLE